MNKKEGQQGGAVFSSKKVLGSFKGREVLLFLNCKMPTG